MSTVRDEKFSKGGVALLEAVEVLPTETKERSAIRKKVRSWNEIRMLQELSKHSLQAPRLLRVEQEADGNTFIWMEQVGQEHLETQPDLFPQALELALRIRELQLPPTIDVQPITSEWHLQNLKQGPDLRDVCGILNFSAADTAFVWELFQKVQRNGLYGEPLVFAHGDLHPRNIMLRQNDGIGKNEQELVVIDWEKAGKHSIFQDLYALLHMCYPEADANLLPAEQERLFHQYTAQFGVADRLRGYETFLWLNRLYELVQISKDLRSGLREKTGLLMQAMFVRNDLQRRWQVLGGLA